MGYPHSHELEVGTILSRHFGDPKARDLTTWLTYGGYEGLKKALDMEPAEITSSTGGYFTDLSYFGFFTWGISGPISLSQCRPHQMKTL